MPLRILVQPPRDSLSGDFSAAKASSWPGLGGSALIRERATFLCLDSCNQKGQSVMDCLFIDVGWAVGLIPNRDTKRKRGSS